MTGGGADELLRKDEALLARLGHYFAATLYHEGEWYWGLDRLGHLEERLLAQGLGDPGDRALRFDRTWRGVFDPVAAPLPDPQPLELYFSARSPYSYIAYFRAKTFASALGLPVILKPVAADDDAWHESTAGQKALHPDGRKTRSGTRRPALRQYCRSAWRRNRARPMRLHFGLGARAGWRRFSIR